MWEPTLELQVGLIDNSLSSHEGAAYVPDDDRVGDQSVREVTVFDGLDLGWTYTSELAFDVTHDLSVVSKTTKGVAKKLSATPMSVSSIGAITLGRGDAGRANEATYYALSASREDDVPPTAAAVANDPDDVGSCQPVSTFGAEAGANLWAYNDNLASRISKPDNCFRITVDHGLTRNYLDPYTVELDPNGADIAWGKVAWEAWEELTCAPMEFSAMDQVDVCAMFEEEVARSANANGRPGRDDSRRGHGLASNIVKTPEGDEQQPTTLEGFNLSFKDAAADRHRFVAMWYARKKADGKAEMPPPNLYATDATDDADPAVTTRAHTANVVSGYDATAWVATLDDDNDPIYGDLGKVTIDWRGHGGKLCGWTTIPTRAKQMMAARRPPGRLRIRMLTRTALCATLAMSRSRLPLPSRSGWATVCDPVKVEYTLTCDWSSRGNAAGSVNFDACSY